MGVILTLILFPFILGLLLCVIIWATNRLLKKMVIEKHQALEEISSTGRVPREWSEPFEKKISRTDDPEKSARLRARANKRYLKKLDSLTRYVETSTLVAGERTRQVLLGKLAETRKLWQSGETGASESDQSARNG